MKSLFELMYQQEFLLQKEFHGHWVLYRSHLADLIHIYQLQLHWINYHPWQQNDFLFYKGLSVLPVLGNESIHFNINYSELEELLNLNTMFLKTSNTVHGEGTDANDFLNFQVYRYSSGTQNIPENSDGQILTITSVLNMQTRPIIQFAVTQNSTFYLRAKWYSKNWSGWIKIK